jgi:hypothetical protein
MLRYSFEPVKAPLLEAGICELAHQPAPGNPRQRGYRLHHGEHVDVVSGDLVRTTGRITGVVVVTVMSVMLVVVMTDQVVIVVQPEVVLEDGCSQTERGGGAKQQGRRRDRHDRVAGPNMTSKPPQHGPRPGTSRSGRDSLHPCHSYSMDCNPGEAQPRPRNQ